MMGFIEIKKINFNEKKVIQPDWETKLHKRFPESTTLSQEQYFHFLYDIALPYDELIYLEKVLNYTPTQIERICAARELIKYFIISIERFPDYNGKGNGF